VAWARPGKETGWESSQRHADVQLNLWQLFRAFCKEFGGQHCGRSTIALDDRNAVEPDQYYFAGRRADCTIAGGYFQGVPRLIAEVLSPATRALDRGPRMEVYRRAGSPHLWLLDPETETVEEYALTQGQFHKTGQSGAGETFCPALFPETSVAVDSLFDTQDKRHGEIWDPTELEPVPAWLVAPEQRLGLEVLFFFGHPERRYEIWNNRAPCVLAFGSAEEAEMRFGHFFEEICRWERAPLSRPRLIEPGVEIAEAGRFQLTRQGRQIRLDVAVDGQKFRDLLGIWNITRRGTGVGTERDSGPAGGYVSSIGLYASGSSKPAIQAAACRQVGVPGGTLRR
jgi:Uma2 family endonuclease